MPKRCAAVGCGNHSLQAGKVSFFLFPTESEKRSKWAQALKRVNTDGTRWSPKSKWTYICGRHFINGKPHPEPDHPDYTPSVFVYTAASTIRTATLEIDRFNLRLRRAATKKSLQFVDCSSGSPERVNKLDGSPSLRIPPSIPTTPMSDVELLTPRSSTTDRSAINDDTLLTADQHVQTEQSVFLVDSERTSLNHEIQNLRNELNAIKAQKASKFTSDMIRENDKKALFYTGLTWTVFGVLVKLCELKLAVVADVQPCDQIFLTLVRLRHNVKVEYLSDQVGIASSSVNKIFWNVMQVLYETIAIRREIERVIGYLKKRYTILKDIKPISLITFQSDEADQVSVTNIDVIVRVCAALTNMSTGIFRPHDEKTE